MFIMKAGALWGQEVKQRECSSPPTRFNGESSTFEEDRGSVSRTGDIQPPIVCPLQEPTGLGERHFKIWWGHMCERQNAFLNCLCVREYQRPDTRKGVWLHPNGRNCCLKQMGSASHHMPLRPTSKFTHSAGQSYMSSHSHDEKAPCLMPGLPHSALEDSLF